MARQPADPDPTEQELKQHSALLLADAISLEEFRRRMAALAARRLDCMRIAVWRVSEGDQGPWWRCVARWQADAGFDNGGDECADIGSPATPAIVDALLSVNGRRLGVLRCERRDPAQPWPAREVAALRRIAAAVSLVIARREGVVEAVPEALGQG